MWVPFQDKISDNSRRSFFKLSIVFFKFVGFILIYFFIFFCLHWVFVAVHGLCLAVVSRDYCLLWYKGFSLQRLLLLGSTASRARGLQ